MAKKQTPTVQDYHKSETYKNADAETRRNLHRYKSELNITDEQMNWLMALEDVRLTPKEQRRKGNATAEMMVIGSTVTFLLAVNVGQRAFMLIASVFFIFAAGLYPVCRPAGRWRADHAVQGALHHVQLWCAVHPGTAAESPPDGRFFHLHCGRRQP